MKAGIPLDARETQVEHMEYPAPAILADGDLGQKSLAAQETESGQKTLGKLQKSPNMAILMIIDRYIYI